MSVCFPSHPTHRANWAIRQAYVQAAAGGMTGDVTLLIHLLDKSLRNLLDGFAAL